VKVKRTGVVGKRISLRARLTLVYGGLFLVAGVVLLGVTYALFNQQIAGIGVKMITKDTKVTVSPSASSSPPPGGAGSAAPTVPDDSWVRIQQSEIHAAATTSLITQGAIALAIVGGAAAGFGWLIAGRVLAPLHRVTETARRIANAPAADRGLHERIALRGPDDEVKDLADTFDLMVERLGRSFDGQRRFVANASHELRTPLTLGRALVELAMHRRTASEDVKQLGEGLLEINTRHERLIGGLMLLAGSEREITERLPVDLADVLSHVVTQTEPEAARAGVTVKEEPAPALTTGDALLLERLVHNLVENAVRHNLPDGDGGWVRIACRTHGHLVELDVTNTGPAVPPYEIPSLFEPFRRLGTDRLVTAKGAGLGLSIIRAIAHAHGGDVTAHPREGGGLTVTVTLPGLSLPAG
jgi:signal transduction histidine kinase